MMIEGSGSGSIPLTSGSGSGRPKNMWIRWIRIRIRIRNTALNPLTWLSKSRYLNKTILLCENFFKTRPGPDTLRKVNSRSTKLSLPPPPVINQSNYVELPENISSQRASHSSKLVSDSEAIPPESAAGGEPLLPPAGFLACAPPDFTTFFQFSVSNILSANPNPHRFYYDGRSGAGQA